MEHVTLYGSTRTNEAIPYGSMRNFNVNIFGSRGRLFYDFIVVQNELMNVLYLPIYGNNLFIKFPTNFNLQLSKSFLSSCEKNKK